LGGFSFLTTKKEGVVSIFSNYALPVVAVHRSRNLLELLEKNKISPNNVRKAVIGPRHLRHISSEIAKNVLLAKGELVTIFLDSKIYWSGILSD